MHESGTIWPAPGGSGNGPRHVLPLDTLTKMLAGVYDLALITTEGVETPTVDWWRLLLVPIDTAWRGATGRVAGDWMRYPLAGTRLDVPAPTPRDSLRRRRYLARSDLEFQLDLRSGDLKWLTDPGVSDGGAIFDIGEVSDSLLFGRWVDGSIIMVPLTRRGLEVGESWRGYYCAWKVK